VIFSVTLIAVETKNSNNMNDPIRLEVCPTWVVEQKFDNPSFYLEHFKNLEYRKTHTKMSVNSKILDLPYMSDLKDILTDTIRTLRQQVSDLHNHGLIGMMRANVPKFISTLTVSLVVCASLMIILL
jgi:hypothetical protein